MPIYEYQCQQCGHHHEALQKISDPQLRQCPECGRKSLKRLVSAVFVSLMVVGSGSVARAKPDKQDAAKPDTPAESATTAASGDGAAAKGTRVSRSVAAPLRSKGNGGTKPARRAPAARQRRR